MSRNEILLLSVMLLTKLIIFSFAATKPPFPNNAEYDVHG